VLSLVATFAVFEGAATTVCVPGFPCLFAQGPNVLSVFSFHQCVVEGQGNVHCWGNEPGGTIGDYGGGNAISVSAGSFTSCALIPGRDVNCWGDNFWGQAAPYTGGDAIGVSVGGYHTCFLLTTGKVTCQGGRYGVGETAPYNTGDAIALSSGFIHNCVLTNLGNVNCWGDNTWGQSAGYAGGDGVQVASGEYHTCVLTNLGNVKCWGVGGGFTYNGGDAISIGASGGACAILSNHNVHCFGPSGGLGGYLLSNAMQVASSMNRACALTDTGVVTCWSQAPSPQGDAPYVTTV
jgi:hypothetical protein